METWRLVQNVWPSIVGAPEVWRFRHTTGKRTKRAQERRRRAGKAIGRAEERSTFLEPSGPGFEATSKVGTARRTAEQSNGHDILVSGLEGGDNMRYYTIYPDGKVSGNIRVCQDKDAWYTYPSDHLRVATEADKPVIECTSYNNGITGFIYASDTEWHTIYVCDVPGTLASQEAVWRSPYDIVLKDEIYSVVFNLPLGHTMSIDLAACTLLLHAEGARLYVTRYDRKTKVIGQTEKY